MANDAPAESLFQSREVLKFVNTDYQRSEDGQ